MNITLRQIDIFIACAHFQSVSGAARSLYLTQPVVSRQLREMEERLGMKLFDRSNRGVVLSVDGDRLFAQLDPIYQRFRISVGQVLDNNPERNLHIGCFHDPDTIKFMESAITRCKEQYPAIGIESEFFNFHDLTDMLLCGLLDVIFTFSFETERHPDICSHEVGVLQPFFIVPSIFGVSASGGDLSILGDKTLLLEVHNGREAALGVCAAHGFSPAEICYARSILLMDHWIIEGKGFTVGGNHLPGLSDRGIGVEYIPSSAAAQNFRVVAAKRKNTENPDIDRFLEYLG